MTEHTFNCCILQDTGRSALCLTALFVAFGQVDCFVLKQLKAALNGF